MKTYLALSAFLSVLVNVGAHTIFQEVYVNGVSQGSTVGIRVPEYDGPISDVNSNDIICNGGINPYRQPVSTKVIDVPAGAQVTAEWHHTLAGAQANDAADPIDPSHKGPVLVYLAQIPSATQQSVTGLKWFKIYHDGLSGGVWGVDRLIQNKGKVTFTIPSCIPSGEYLMRVELIALHAAGSYPGAQFYMECAQLKISGGGNASPATVSFPGAYKGTDPGVTVNIYSNLSSYVIPGPEVFTCSAGSAPTQTSTSTTTATTTAVPTSTTATSTPTSSTPAVGTVPPYGQCGGQGYTGATQCSSGTCVKLNDYYSQCI
ncbi:glycosyl hydrolase family 61-domain-containing protein [Ephemerocybe angulata]|uniref:AA9 family lytic polysaccharide monooxygenase n=1 Tax=Ephemerocybe angulata TaxID=980116 RepID=A0A8H6MB09_9AGAR|nr:glycosyl hydrolase family 61-domain-containing protein [Tulosesus angulatus]